MNNRFFKASLHFAFLLAAASAGAQNTAFTFQGRVHDGGLPATGLYDMRFQLFDQPELGTAMSALFSSNGVPVSSGLVTVTLDFGSSPFNGTTRWLEIGFKTNGAVSFVELSPRMLVAPAPYAIYAHGAGTVSNGAIGTLQLATNAVTSSRIASSSVGQAQLALGAVTTSKIASSAVGQAQLAPGAVTASKIAAGQVVKSLNGFSDAVTLSAGSNVSMVATGNGIRISAVPGTLVTNVGWGISGNSGTSSGTNFLGTLDYQPLELGVNGERAWRLEPSTDGAPNLIGGCSLNAVALGTVGAVIAGGGTKWWDGVAYSNFVFGDFGVVGGGADNRALGILSTVPGGFGNYADGRASFAAGQHAKAWHDGAFVWADSESADFGSTSSNQFLIRASGGVGIGTNNPQSALQVAGTVTAHAFSGSGSGLSDLPSANLKGPIPGELLPMTPDRGFTMHAATRYIPPACQQPFFTWDNTNRCDLWVGFATNGVEQWRFVLQYPTSDFFISSPGDGIDSPRLYLPHSTPDVLLTPETGNVGIGTSSPQARLDVAGETRTCVLTITGGCDVAEPFQVSQNAIPKGAVVVIDEDKPGHLRMSDRPCDNRVAGIVSGANGINPGLTLRQEGTLEGTQNVALTGRVYALADASEAPIKPGDLLTTSATPGHCMKVTDAAKAQGAILGKALTALKAGQGYVLVLVSLQ